MLNLSVSTQPCLPGTSRVQITRPRPLRCETCGSPGGTGGAHLEAHIVAKDRVKFLCPLCHMCLHLDYAGRKKAGTVIWLPELTQERINVQCLASFVALRQASLFRTKDETRGIVESATRLYTAFERRAESLQTYLGGTAVKSLMPRQSLSSPSHIASLLVQVQRETNFSQKTLAQRVDGLRLLPAPEAFDAYISHCARITSKEFAVQTWAARANSAVQAHNSAQSAEPEEQFTAERETAEGL